MQVAVDTEHHLIVAHEVTNCGSDRAQLANMAKQAKAVLKTDTLDAVADRGYFNSPEILACREAGITVTLPKPLTSSAKSEGRFGKPDFAYLPEEDVYRCPAGERLTYRYTNEEDGKTLRRYWTTACPTCSLKSQCTPAPERRLCKYRDTSYISGCGGETLEELALPVIRRVGLASRSAFCERSAEDALQSGDEFRVAQVVCP